MPSTAEAVLLVLGVLLIIAGLAGGAVKAFNVELPAVPGGRARAALLGLGAGFILLAVWLLVADRTGGAPAPTAAALPAPTPAAAAPAASSTPAPPTAPTAAPAPATPPAASLAATAPAAQGAGEALGPGQTVSGTLIGSEAAVWSVAGGHGPLDLVLDVGPFGDGLMIVEDGAGVRRDYVDAQSGPEERLLGLEIPAGETYRVTVRNSSNAQVDYSLAVSATPPPRPIARGETVAGELYYNEGATWLFEGGPATIDVTVELGPHGDALLLVFDPGGVRREYVDAQTGPQERLRGYEIPSGGAYMLVVRNTHNTPTGYTLAVGP